MRLPFLKHAITEAERFLVKAKRALEVFEDDGYVGPDAKVAAAKRASLDLTKALAAMRVNR